MGSRSPGYRPAGERSVGKRPAGYRPAGERSVGKRPAGYRPAGERPFGVEAGGRQCSSPPRDPCASPFRNAFAALSGPEGVGGCKPGDSHRVRSPRHGLERRWLQRGPHSTGFAAFDRARSIVGCETGDDHRLRSPRRGLERRWLPGDVMRACSRMSCGSSSPELSHVKRAVGKAPGFPPALFFPGIDESLGADGEPWGRQGSFGAAAPSPVPR